MTDLEEQLAEAIRVRDLWCEEYTKLRDELKTKIEQIEFLMRQIALGMGIRSK